LRADKEGRGLGELYNVVVPSSWPPEFWDQKAMDYLYQRIRRYPQFQGWCRYVTVKQALSAPPILIGGCGCIEPPQTVDDVEIGYSILSEFRRQGYITEALNGFIPWI